MKLLPILFFLITFSILPFPVSSAGIVPCGQSTDDTTTTINEASPCTLCHIITGGKSVIDYGLKIMTGVAIAVIVAMAIFYIISTGDESMMSTAKGGIKATLIGFAVMLSSWLIISTTLRLFSATIPGLSVSPNGFSFSCDTAEIAATIPTPPPFRIGAGSGATPASCGSATTNQASSTTPTTNLCTAGTPSSVTVNEANSTYNWTCESTARSVACSAPRSILVGNNTPDTTPPSTPTGLIATNASTGGVTLTWNPSTDTSGIDVYNIYRNGSLYATVGGDMTSFIDTDVLPLTTYTYTVQAVDGATPPNTGIQSAGVSVTTGADTQAPTIPRYLSAQVISPTQVTLTWDASSDNVGVKDYLIYRRVGTGTPTIRTVTTTTYTDTTMVSGVEYTYTVVAEDNAGNKSGESIGVVVGGVAVGNSGTGSAPILTIYKTSIPNPSKEGSKYPTDVSNMPGGAGPINAYPIDPSLCNSAPTTRPPITGLWYHNIDFDAYAPTRGVDIYKMRPNEALIYGFTPNTTGLYSIYFSDATIAAYVSVFASISTTPCDFDATKVPTNTTAAPDFCYMSRDGASSIQINVTDGPVTWGQCKLTPGQRYYFNLRFQSTVRDIASGIPADSCAASNNTYCGGLFTFTK